MGASKDPAGGSNVEIYLRLKPTPKASPLVTLDTVRPVVILRLAVGTAETLPPARRASRAEKQRDGDADARNRARVSSAAPAPSRRRPDGSRHSPSTPADPVPSSHLAHSFIHPHLDAFRVFSLSTKTSPTKTDGADGSFRDPSRRERRVRQQPARDVRF